MKGSGVDQALAIAVIAAFAVGLSFVIRWHAVGKPTGEESDLAGGCAIGVILGVLFVAVLITINWWIGRWP